MQEMFVALLSKPSESRICLRGLGSWIFELRKENCSQRGWAMASSISKHYNQAEVDPKSSMLVVSNDEQGPEQIYRMISW
jgi:hypothetical protein